VKDRADDEARSKLVLTVGHSTRTFEELLGLLRAHGARRLVDVRRFPHSPRHPHFRADFERLVGLCEERVCLMCSEAVWWRCHRRMIADALAVRGFSVEHILGEQRRTPHTLTPWAEVLDGEELLYPPER
jgi:uncharacterized protein (DUF488 family)